MKLSKSLFILLLATMLLPIKAQNIIHPKIAGPNGLWVNSYNGILFFERTDMETQNSAMPMSLRFYYNSSRYATDYGYGLGFSLGYEMRYSVDANGNVSIETGDGRTDTYKRYGTDYEAPAGVFGLLEKSENGTYTLTEKDGTVYFFGDTRYHKLTAITDRNGNKTELVYTDSLLTQIKDAVGHTISLSYANGLLVSAQSSFHQGTIKYEYDADRCLKKRTDAMGYSILYAYDHNNRLEAITDANGNKTMIAYNPAGMCSRLKTDVTDKSIRYDGDKTIFIDYTQPKNQYSYYRWDGKGRVIEKVGLCCGSQTQLEYDEDDNVIKRIDANGGMSTYTYDDRGNMLSVTDALGHTERYTYETVFNQVASYQDKNGNTYRFSYDAKGNLISISGPLGFSNSFTYNDKGWPLTTTDANNNVTATTYNEDGTVSRIMDAAGYISSFTYDVSGNLLTANDGRNHMTTYIYDKNNRILSQTDALGGTTTVSYDKVGNVVRVKDAKNRITAYTYDAIGQVLTITDAMGGVTTYTYDGKGNVLTITDPLGQMQTMTYNDKNKLLSRTNAADETTSFDYDAKGNLISIFQPNGNIISYSYGATDLLEQVCDNVGMIAKYTYDANGNRLTLTDGLDRTVTYAYDALNRCVSETLPSGSKTSYTYDNNSNLLSVTDALGHSTQYTYTSLNQQLTHLDALNAKTQFEYDANGNLIKATDANGHATVWTYDALNRNTHITFADGRSLQYGYDELGNVISSKDRAGNTSKYVYDALGRLLSKTYADGTKDVYTYDAIGQMLSAVNKDATVNFSYDRAGRLLSETLNGKSASYAYDIAAGKRSMIYPSGMKVDEQLNARDLITNILQNGQEVVAMTYNIAGQKASQIYANGITTNYSYNNNGWLEQIADVNSILNLKMSYDGIGNISKREDFNNATQTENYTYDVISQLVGFTRGETVNTQFTFDLLGNRIKVLENNVATNYISNNVNAYTSINGKLSFTPQYDENGNLLKDDRHNYAYNLNNKLVSVDGTAGQYGYDALGRRISKTTADGTTDYYYVGDQMVEEYVDDILHASYLYGNNIDEILQMKKGSDVYYYHTNHLGSVMALTDGEGTLIERIAYDAYGEPTFMGASGVENAQSSVGNTILFTGREYDYESGIYYYRARSLHPRIGRFMQHDPLMYVDGMNDYTYAFNNSVFHTDIYGLSAFTEATDFTSEATGNMANMMGGKLGNYNWGNNGIVYKPGFHGNQYVKIQGNIGNAGSLLGVGSTLLKAPGYFEKMSNVNSWSEYGGHLGNFAGGAFGGMAGVEAGVAIGGAIGGLFAGVGAVPGAVIGGVVGGLIGGIAGDKIGSWGGEKIGKFIGGQFDIPSRSTIHSSCDPADPPCHFDPCTKTFYCGVSK